MSCREISDDFGKTAEFSVWSHAGKDGPTGTIATSHNALDGKQMTLEGWGNVDFNWALGANANFYGCKIGVGDNSNPTYMVREPSLGIAGRFFPTFTLANPMRTSRNGKGVVDRYYQPGIRY